jgi:hypothetical protein
VLFLIDVALPDSIQDCLMGTLDTHKFFLSLAVSNPSQILILPYLIISVNTLLYLSMFRRTITLILRTED